MRVAVVVLVVGLIALLASGCDDSCGPGPCKIAESATFDLSCAPSTLSSVVASGPCARGDASLANYATTSPIVSVSSESPGTCDVQITFANGFAYAKDVEFTSQPGACGCGTFIGPTSGPFTVNNPSDTCVDAGPGVDAAADAGADR